MSEFSRAKHREMGLEREMEVLPYFLPDEARTRAATTPSPHPRPYFFFAGRLERIKGLDDVIPGFAALPEADLVIAGDGEHARVLRDLGAGLSNVHFLGRLPPEALDSYYRHAIASLVPSVCYETFGIVAIEALRQGTPVIARRIGPLPEILERADAGIIFSTPGDLRAALRRLQSDPVERQRLAANASSAVLEHWTESAVLPRYLDLIRRSAVRRGHSHIAALLEPQESM